MDIKRIILNNIGLKVISLFLAVIAWIYIVGELNKATPEEKAALERLLPYRMKAKFLPVELDITGEPKKGYEVMTDEVTVSPEGIMVIGPSSLLDRISFIRTEPIDVGEYAKSLTRDVYLIPLARGLSVKEKFVTVTVPIKKQSEE